MTIGAGTIGATPVGGVQRRRGEIALVLSAGADRDTSRSLAMTRSRELMLTAARDRDTTQPLAITRSRALAVAPGRDADSAREITARTRAEQLVRQIIAVTAAVESSAATAGATDRSQQTASAADSTRQTSGSATRETAAPAASSSDQEE